MKQELPSRTAELVATGVICIGRDPRFRHLVERFSVSNVARTWELQREFKIQETELVAVGECIAVLRSR